MEKRGEEANQGREIERAARRLPRLQELWSFLDVAVISSTSHAHVRSALRFAMTPCRSFMGQPPRRSSGGRRHLHLLHGVQWRGQETGGAIREEEAGAKEAVASGKERRGCNGGRGLGWEEAAATLVGRKTRWEEKESWCLFAP